MLRFRRPGFLLALATLAFAPLTACHAPSAHAPRVLTLKTVHPPTGRCGHHPATIASTDDATAASEHTEEAGR